MKTLFFGKVTGSCLRIVLTVSGDIMLDGVTVETSIFNNGQPKTLCLYLTRHNRRKMSDTDICDSQGRVR